MSKLTGKLDQVEERYESLARLMAEPEVVSDPQQAQRYGKEKAELEDLVTKYQAYRATIRRLEETQSLLDDGLEDELVEMAKEEVEALKARQGDLMDQIKVALLTKDPNDEKDVIVEIRAGTGGEEAALFGAVLYRMYSRYAERHRWQIELINANPTGIGGLKEVVFEIHGRGAYSRLKYESGVHRVQRIPTTESGGRIHTSTATVAVLPEVEEVEVNVNPEDLRIDVYHSAGAGGQNVQKVATAIRITHVPTGLVVTCQDERSQLKNRMKAMAVLRARLYAQEQRKQTEQIEETRRLQVGSGDRSEKIRTYNFPQDRITDHRVGLTVHRLPAVLDGELDELIDTLITTDQADRLKAGGLDA